MRESRTYGSVRGALSNERPYRDPYARSRASFDALWRHPGTIAQPFRSPPDFAFAQSELQTVLDRSHAELSGLAETLQIGRHDRFHQGRRDAKPVQRAPLLLGLVRDNVVL